MSKPDQICPASARSRFASMIIYGLPGIGKTFLAGTSSNGLILDCGTDETDTNAAAGQSVDVWEVRDLSSLEESYEYCRHEGVNDYDWVWVDGLSPLEGRLMRELLRDLVAASPHRSLYVPDKAEYLKIQSYLDRFTQLFADLPMHVGFTAHVDMHNVRITEADGEITEVNMMMPMIQGGQGRLSQKLCSYMNIVGYMDMVETEENGLQRAIMFGPDRYHIVKDRFAVLGQEQGWMLNPTVPKIEAAIKGKLAKGPRKAAAKKTAKKATGTTKKATGKKSTGLRA